MTANQIKAEKKKRKKKEQHKLPYQTHYMSWNKHMQFALTIKTGS